MAEFLPFRALRYRAEVVGKIDHVLSPPYDVIDRQQETELRARSPYNVIQLELSEARPDDDARSNRYTRAAALLAEWQAKGALAFDEEPAYYVYTQEFEHDGARHRRTQLFGRLRLEPWEAGIVRPHEETMAKPKADRLEVMRHLQTNISPLFALYRDEGSTVASALEAGEPLIEAATPDGQRHTLRAIRDAATTDAIAGALASTPFYMLDGHHRYETALAYREERRTAAAAWAGDEPANFVLTAITPIDDPGLVLLPTHRLVRPHAVPGDLMERLSRYFQVEDTTPKSYDGTALFRLMARLRAAGNEGVAFGVLGLEEQRLHLLTLRDEAAARSLMPEGTATWQTLDVNVLEYAILRAALDITDGAGEVIDYTQDATVAMREVEAGRWPLAVLLNPTRVSQMLAVADAGEKMPAKSTYFYPKLATGLVLNTLG